MKEKMDIVMGIIKCLIAVIVSSLLPVYRNAWLITERYNEARDNGYWFFEYLNRCHPEIESYYLIDPASPDYKKVAQIGRCVVPGSIKHGLLFYNARVIAPAHRFYRFTPHWTGVGFLRRHNLIRNRGIVVFLQHGITKDQPQHLSPDKLPVDIFVCGAEPEYRYLCNDSEYDPSVLRYTGFSRFDNLYKYIATKPHDEIEQIVFMPTWRRYLYGLSREEFTKTRYYREYVSLLNSPVLLGMLKEYDCHLIFYLHYMMQEYTNLFPSGSERVTVADREHYEVQQLLVDSDMMITDYSSVAFDMAYIHKPVIYYQFDYDEYRAGHLPEGYYDYRNGLGPVTESLEGLLEVLKDYLEGNAPDIYDKRIKDFFPVQDDHNSERIYDAIEETLNSRRRDHGKR